MEIIAIHKMQSQSQWKKFESFVKQVGAHGGLWQSEERYIIGRHFGPGYISEVLQRRFIQKLQPSQPVFISAQTGTGKSTLIFETIMPIMKERGQRVLILSSRRALDLQMKMKVMDELCPELREQLTTIGIFKKHSYGLVEVWTYQSIWGMLQRDPGYLKQFGAVILDEVHYFESDAAFNATTLDCLKNIVKGARNALRFYLTATPDRVFDQIVTAEFESLTLTQKEKIDQPDGNVRFLLFDFERDYGYLNVMFFYKTEEIINRIKEDKTEVKWLYFTSKKGEGKEVLQCLGENLANYIDSDTKTGEDAEVFDLLISNQKFEKKVLIATKVLDVGVNLWDEDLSVIVIDSLNKSDFLQMIGRKRVAKNEKIRVYIKVPTSQSIGRKLGGCLEQLQRWENLKNLYNFGNIQNFTTLPFPFYVQMRNNEPLRIFWNELSFDYLQNEIIELRKFQNENEEERLVHILSWLNKNTPPRWLNPTVRADLHWLVDWLNTQANVIMKREHYDSFRTELTDKLRENGLIDLRGDRSLGISAINSFFSLNNLPFQLKSSDRGVHELVEG